MTGALVKYLAITDTASAFGVVSNYRPLVDIKRTLVEPGIIVHVLGFQLNIDLQAY